MAFLNEFKFKNFIWAKICHVPVKSCPQNWDHATMLALGWNNYIKAWKIYDKIGSPNFFSAVAKNVKYASKNSLCHGKK